MLVNLYLEEKMAAENEGVLLVLSSPSGAGKTTILERLLERSTNSVRSVSMTTRKPRPGEINGKDYFLLPRKNFMSYVKLVKCLSTPEFLKIFMAYREVL